MCIFNYANEKDRSRTSSTSSSSTLQYRPLYNLSIILSLFLNSSTTSSFQTTIPTPIRNSRYQIQTNRIPSQKTTQTTPKRLLLSPILNIPLNYIDDSKSNKQQKHLLTTNTELDDLPPDDEPDPTPDYENPWLGWMSNGKPRGVNDIKMRDPVELGGVPRADRYSSRDWFHNIANLPNSIILRNIRYPVFAMTAWAMGISVLHRILRMVGGEGVANAICIPSTCHSCMVSVLGLLLVFRTNSAYQRFTDGRKIWENILNTSRDLSRMAKLYENEIGTEKRRRVQRLLAAFPYLLRHRIRPNTVMRPISDTSCPRDQNSLLLYDDSAKNDNDPESASIATDEETTGRSRRKPRQLYWVDKRTLPWRLLPPGAMEACARAQNRPLWVCDRLSKELQTVPDGPNFTNRERLALLKLVDQLSHAIGACERIHQTVVPLNYARHALRSLTFWLLSLPFAIVQQLGLVTGPGLFVMSWMLFGVYEIGTRIEDPFQGTLRLSILCDAIRRDVLGDELIRETAFRLDVVERRNKESEGERERQVVNGEIILAP